MKAFLEIKGENLKVDFSKGKDISISLLFNGPQPNTYNVSKATSRPYIDGQFIGDTRKGGPCNFETYSITPHCNGTHTECIGHITEERVSILNSLKEEIILSTLITVVPENTKEKYSPPLNSNDLIITKEQLEDKLKNINPHYLNALIIRTLPNSNNKKERDYMQNPSPFFSIDSMNYIVSLGVRHLLVDIPSVDRLFDDGILSAHNIFWETKRKELNNNTACKTITEMVFVPNEIEDGKYLLNLQIAPFAADAAPSRPIIYNINEL